MRVVVCVKQVLDPELPAEEFTVDPVAKRPAVENARLVMSTFDEIALEAALQLREAIGEASVVALSLGGRSADDVLRKALAMGAQEALRIDASALEEPDGVQTASALAAAIRGPLWPVDVVICGRQAADTDAGQVGPILAEMLGFPLVTNVLWARPGPGGTLHLERETEEGTEVVEVTPPVLLTVTNAECNVPRMPKVRDILAAQRKSVPAVEVGDLQPEVPSPWTVLTDLSLPQLKGRCRVIEAETVEEKVEALLAELDRLRVV
ncbi:MAG: electron transfer flavoprotein subunit beta/FixA family protein [Armatimonadetes bacterium]|nr:electron transfer flavoprotein subunit beta/FixA family protein [Armatimonadota bacterium]MDW8153148.1 electron transfer flavoprotein subunit beta/FixA family protein [Armatimonadota bacterium]